MRKHGRPTTFAVGLPCPQCHVLIDLDSSHFTAFFQGNAATCPHCSGQMDLWAQLTQHVRDHDLFGTSLRLAGATSIMVSVPIGWSEVKEVDLTEHGMPLDAELLAIELTPGGGGLAGVLHGRQALADPVRGPKVLLFARPLIARVHGNEHGYVEIVATWFVRTPGALSMDHLMEGARHFRARRFVNMIVPAQIAAETALAPLLTRATNKTRRPYKKQLHVDIGHVAGRCGTSDLPAALRTVLERLRLLRNEIAHAGACSAQSREDAAEHLTAAMFAMRYAGFLAPAVDRALAAGQLP